MDKEDVNILYNAFIQLCDYVEKETGDSCSKCPLSSTVCFTGNKTDGEKFSMALQRIREECGIERDDLR